MAFSPKKYSIGWVTNPKFYNPRIYLLEWLVPDIQMRFKPIAQWINKNSEEYYNEIYNPNKRYNIVIFLKIISDRAVEEAKKIKTFGGKIIFDSNVNYYEIWGEYPVPGTKPKEEQQKQAIWMTLNADYVVADSRYIGNICLKINQNTVWIPDNVDVLNQYTGKKKHANKEKVTLIWSGFAKKAFHFELIEDCLYSFADRIKILIVTSKESNENKLPEVVHRMKKKLNCEIRMWNAGRNPTDLLESDIIISPKILNNGYEMGHSEYKISLGMAQRLPAIASNQPSYIDAFDGKQAGFICKDEKDWHSAFGILLNSDEKRQEMGDVARERVINKYSVEVISNQYLDVFNKLVR